MSQKQNQEPQQSEEEVQKFNKTKQEREKEKNNTNAWLKKQEEKKKKKLEEQAQEQKPVELDQKALEKAKRKEQKRLERQQMLKEQGLTVGKQGEVTAKVEQVKKEEKTEVKKQGKKKQQKKQQKTLTQSKQAQQLSKKPSKKTESQPLKPQQVSKQQSRKLSKQNIPIPSVPAIAFTQLLTLQQHLRKSHPSQISSINKTVQTQLIHKYLDQYVNCNDTVLILSRSDNWQPSLTKCTKRVFLYPIHDEFVKNQDCENIVCTYEDVAYLMDGTITKIFVELDVFFANGVALSQKGNLNVIALANQFKIPVIGFTGTWDFNAWNYLSTPMFLNKYGQSYVQNFDILYNDLFEIIVLQIGPVIPKQISGHMENLSKIYRGCDLNAIKW